MNSKIWQLIVQSWLLTSIPTGVNSPLMRAMMKSIPGKYLVFDKPCLRACADSCYLNHAPHPNTFNKNSVEKHNIFVDRNGNRKKGCFLWDWKLIETTLELFFIWQDSNAQLQLQRIMGWYWQGLHEGNYTEYPQSIILVVIQVRIFRKWAIIHFFVAKLGT